MTNTTEDEIKALQIKAGEIYDHFQNCSAVYVCSGQEIFELNRENHDDCFTKNVFIVSASAVNYRHEQKNLPKRYQSRAICASPSPAGKCP